MPEPRSGMPFQRDFFHQYFPSGYSFASRDLTQIF
jgi:hypothetical protein